MKVWAVTWRPRLFPQSATGPKLRMLSHFNSQSIIPVPTGNVSAAISYEGYSFAPNIWHTDYIRWLCSLMPHLQKSKSPSSSDSKAKPIDYYTLPPNSKLPTLQHLRSSPNNSKKSEPNRLNVSNGWLLSSFKWNTWNRIGSRAEVSRRVPFGDECNLLQVCSDRALVWSFQMTVKGTCSTN